MDHPDGPRIFTPPAAPDPVPHPAASPQRFRTRTVPEPWTMPGLCWNTPVTTSFGVLPVQALRAHDPVRTATGAYLRVQRVDQLRLDEGYLASCPDAVPVVIRAGSLGPDRPATDLVVSPHQQVNLSDSLSRPDLRKARDLTGRPNVFRQAASDVTYFMLHCGMPATLLIDGVALALQP